MNDDTLQRLAADYADKHCLCTKKNGHPICIATELAAAFIAGYQTLGKSVSEKAKELGIEIEPTKILGIV